jgi:hypothetical protein
MSAASRSAAVAPLRINLRRDSLRAATAASVLRVFLRVKDQDSPGALKQVDCVNSGVHKAVRVRPAQ